MKRIVAVMLAFVLAVGFTAASAEEPKETVDFTGYTLEELLEIQSDLEEEIAQRPGGEKMTLGAGQYEIGADLPAGVYTFRFVQNGKDSVERTDYYVYENESMYKYDIDRLWLGDMPRLEGSLRGDGETRISLYEGEYLSLRYNGAEVARVRDVTERGSDYVVPTGTTIPMGEYTVGEEIPAGTYKICYSGTTTSRVRVFENFEESDNTFNEGKETVLNADNTEGTVVLEDGNIFRVEYTPIIMAKSEGFKFDFE